MGNGGRITDGGLSASEQQVKEEAGEVKGNGCGVMGGKGRLWEVADCAKDQDHVVIFPERSGELHFTCQ